MAERDIISSIKELRDAILNYEVKEVSSDLVFNFPPSLGPSLYDPNLGFAWSGSSATLYDLLVLNQRFQSSSIDSSSNDRNVLKIDRKVLNGLQRGVGFGFGYQTSLSAEELENTNYPVFDVVDTFAVSLVIFDKKNGPFTAFDADGKEISIDQLTIDQRIPTQAYWQELLNEKISKNVDNPIPIPEIVFTEITDHYANSNSTPTNYGNIVGIKDTLFFGGGGPGVLQPDGVSFNDGFTVADFDTWNTFPEEFVSSEGAFELMKSVNKSFGVQGTPNFSLDKASGIFYEKFLQKRLEEYNLFKNVNNYEFLEYRKAEIIGELVVLVRSFENFQLASSALNTGSNGEGFSNAANPLVGRSYEDITLSDDSYLDRFMGQEFIIDNLKLPGAGEYGAEGWLSLNSSSVNPDLNDKTYPGDGWFKLDPKRSLGKKDIGGDLSDFKSNFVINDHTIKYAAFVRDSVSSDTLSAAELTSESKDTLQGSTRISNDAFEDVRIDDLVGFGNDFLPDEFSTFISMAGGVDRVTGSRFADVIIGPDQSSLHGTMTLDSGDGDDFVKPGRGQSLLLLGEGSDVIAFSKGDLFGQSIFLDYNMEEDVLIYEKGITAEIDANDGSILYLKDDSSDAMKTVLLSGSSDLLWSEQSIQAGF
ncbi:hypothetical protein [Synechococcus sp. CCY9202]|uniref:hypothetical protein n=1 Tax=Synechococcus sp. CCY9202 TaxID=174698 RepID=UPI002B211F5C|nr:hypothetical protein [Synechococcus sp. CCY9202]MEA5423447.1 hypothetical protein [Synechococcus sp. CCY9202]